MPGEILRSVVFMGLLAVAAAFELDRERLAATIAHHDTSTGRMPLDKQRKLARVAQHFLASYLGAVASICGALYLTWTMMRRP
jgi:aspartate aminotransferase-like enzyme